MAAYRGSQLLLQIGDGSSPETFSDLGGIRNWTLTLNGNPIDVTTVDDEDANGVIWQANISGVRTLSVSGEYLIKSENATEARALAAAFNDGTADNYKLTIPTVGNYVVPMLVTEFTQSGAYDGVVTGQITLSSAGAPTYTQAS